MAKKGAAKHDQIFENGQIVKMAILVVKMAILMSAKQGLIYFGGLKRAQSATIFPFIT